MKAQFQSAVQWLTPICAGIVKNRKIALPEMDFWEPYLELKLEIIQSEGGYEINEGSALVLFERATELPGAFDLACKICGANLVQDRPLPACLRLFAAEVLTGMTARPKGRKGDKTWLANQYKLSLIHRASNDFGLSMTRGDNNPAVSACDAVSKAFDLAGHGVDYFSLKKLCVEKRYEPLRAEFRLWVTKAAEVGFGVLSERYALPDHFKPHVSDESDN